MKVFRSIEELLRRLNNERRLLGEMFNNRKRMEFTLDDARAISEDNNIQLLIDYGVLHLEGEVLEIDETYMRFLEDVMQVNEDISKSLVEDNISLLKENLNNYITERGHIEAQRKYLRKAKRALRAIGQIATRNVIDLKRNVNDTFKNETNYEIKRQRLEKFKQQTIDISSLVRETESLLDHEHTSFTEFAPDEFFRQLSINVRLELKDVYHNLIELQRTIRDYLHQIDAQNRLVKKIRQLKYLRDQLTLRSSTDIDQLAERDHSMLLEQALTVQLKPSLEYLRNSDDALSIIAQVQDKLNRRFSMQHQTPPPLRPDQFNPAEQIIDFVDTDVLAQAFMASGRDLFTFVFNYSYTTPKTLEQRVEIYTEIVLNNIARLSFIDKFEVTQGIAYPLIYPKL